jgi:hypothetical protein
MSRACARANLENANSKSFMIAEGDYLHFFGILENKFKAVNCTTSEAWEAVTFEENVLWYTQNHAENGGEMHFLSSRKKRGNEILKASQYRLCRSTQIRQGTPF